MAHSLGGRRILIVVLVALSAARAQEIPARDIGSDAVVRTLAQLRTTARLLHATAHPDDDDGAMLAYEARGLGVDTVMLTLNRGEGGQNKFGAALFDQLGVLRTLELLEADRYYGVEQRFTRVVDFGFSKTADESFEKWGGHDTALGDLVRVIRTFRPQVIVSPFDGTPRDGHGNHQAAGILAREAFRAAADPQRFPEQIREGLLPWQASKLYVGRGGENALQLDFGVYDPVLGMSYAQFAVEGLQHQMSQGVGGWYVAPGPVYGYYRLVDSVLPAPTEREKSFFDGIDTRLPGLASRLGAEEAKVPFLRPGLDVLVRLIAEAGAGFTPSDPSRAVAPLLSGLQQVQELIGKVTAAPLSPPAKAELLSQLRTKQEQFERAANLALGLQLDASVDAPASRRRTGFFREEQTFLMAVPGQTFTLTVRLYNRGQLGITASDIALDLPHGWTAERIRSDLRPLKSNEAASAQFRVTVPADAAYTRPYWHRDNQQQAVYTIDAAQDATLPLPPWPVHAHAVYRFDTLPGRIGAVAQVKFVDPAYGQSQRPLAVGPPLSVNLDPPVQVISTHNSASAQVSVSVRNDVDGTAAGVLRLQAPAGWRVAPASQPTNFAAMDETKDFNFTLTPAALHEGVYSVNAALEFDGKTYREGYEVIGRQDIGWFYYYRPAQQKISAVDVVVPPKLAVGYIMGAGDDIPAVLRQLGMSVQFLSAADLAGADLSRFHTIVLGIRAYDVRTDVREFNRRLLEYVANGGTLVVQYNASTGVFNQGHFTPYPATLSRDRVDVEEAPVQILDPADPIFHAPNVISARDFDGWVQERGLYFASSWDSHFKPLLACHDPGEPPREGGLLVAPYGKGLYIYTGYAFFRQLPAGVPGAVRLFVNLLSADASHARATRNPSAESAPADAAR